MDRLLQMAAVCDYSKGKTLKERINAYDATEWIQFANKYMRHDIEETDDRA